MTKLALPTRKPKMASVEECARAGANRDIFPIVGIGASAGGFEAFNNVLAHLPEKTGMAFVFVQHLDPNHQSSLPELLTRATRIPITEVSDGAAVESNHIYVIPSNKEMTIREGTLRLSPRTLARGEHKPIDVFLRSLAEACGGRAVGVILSGTGSDGTAGCRAIKAAGGITIAQEGVTARYDRMPRSAVESGCVDFVLSPQGIAEELANIGAHPSIQRVATPSEDAGHKGLSEAVEKLFQIVRRAKGVDFLQYKQRTIQRRVQRRMILNRIEKLADYVKFAEENPNELDELYRDILIHTTGFFRDEKAFKALRKEIFPRLFERHAQDGTPIRIWVPGCATGEEAYSMAIAITEYIWAEASRRGDTSKLLPIQIFATDVSDEALERARAGVYPESALTNVAEETLQRFFMRLEGGYQVGKFIREICLFARQNIVRDPPFSRLDLIACRNVLIYLQPDLQRRVVSALHYGLNPRGYLMLGSSETIGVFGDHFDLVNRDTKIYQKRANAARLITYFTSVYSARKAGGEIIPRRVTGLAVEKELDRLLASRFAPASMVVSADLEVMQLRGKAGAYLQLPSGRPTFNLSKLAPEGLLRELQAALDKALAQNATARREGVSVGWGRNLRAVDLEVIPMQGEASKEKLFVVVFHEHAAAIARSKRLSKKAGRKELSATRENLRLAREINQLRQHVNMLMEDHEQTAEEFRTANEEVLSANEELQSTNEELETAKEELQSNNQELITLNDELQARNMELLTANSDLMNLFGNTELPVVMVGSDLRIRRFTPASQRLLNLLPADIGRRLGQIHPNLDAGDLEKLAEEAVRGAATYEREVRDTSGVWYLMRVRPYKTWDQRIDGAVVSFQDIDNLKRTLQKTRAYADALIESAREAILLLDEKLRVIVANRAFYGTFQAAPGDTEKQLIHELGNGQWNIPELRELLERVARGNLRLDDFEVRHDFPHLGERIMLLNARRIEPEEGQPFVFLSIEDGAGGRRMAALLRQAALLKGDGERHRGTGQGKPS